MVCFPISTLLHLICKPNGRHLRARHQHLAPRLRRDDTQLSPSSLSIVYLHAACLTSGSTRCTRCDPTSNCHVLQQLCWYTSPPQRWVPYISRWLILSTSPATSSPFSTFSWACTPLYPWELAGGGDGGRRRRALGAQRGLTLGYLSAGIYTT